MTAFFFISARRWQRGGEYIELAWVGRVGERRGRQAEVLGKNLGRHVLEPVAQKECVVLVEITIIEDQEKFATIWLKTLDGVRNARRKIPKVSHSYLIDKSAGHRCPAP